MVVRLQPDGPVARRSERNARRKARTHHRSAGIDTPNGEVVRELQQRTTQRFLTAEIRGPSANVEQIEVGAVICGPDFATGEAAVRKMLDSVRFTS